MLTLGDIDGLREGLALGDKLTDTEGLVLGLALGDKLGDTLGLALAEILGETEGLRDGDALETGGLAQISNQKSHPVAVAGTVYQTGIISSL